MTDLYTLWGVAGNPEELDSSLDAYLPIIQVSTSGARQFGVARSPRWQFPSRDVLVFEHETDLRQFGTRLEGSEGIGVADEDFVIVLGRRYRDVCQSVLRIDTRDWNVLDGLALRTGPKHLLRDLTRLVDAPMAALAWTELRQVTADAEMAPTHRARARDLLGALSASPTLPRPEYFALAVGFASSIAAEGIERERDVNRVLRVAQFELGPDSASQVRELATSRIASPSLLNSSAAKEVVLDLRQLVRAPLNEYFSHLGQFVEEFSQKLNQALDLERIPVIDLGDGPDGGHTDGAHIEARRLDLGKLLVLSNLLNGHYRSSSQIQIIPPTSSGIANQVARGGLATRVVQGIADDDSLRGMWTRSWRSSNGLTKETDNASRLFASRLDISLPIHRNLITILNPHHRVWSDDQVVDVQRTVERWISWRTRSLGPRSNTDALDELISTATDVTVQLLSNIRRHAKLSTAPLDFAASGDYSLVQLFTTRGGGRDSSNRLHIAVMDTGIGIPRSVRETIAGQENLTAEQALEGAVSGKLRSDHGGYGLGLFEIVRSVAQLDVERDSNRSLLPNFIIITGDADATMQSVAFSSLGGPAKNGHLDGAQYHSWKAPIEGTLGLATLPLARFGSPRDAAASSAQLDFDLGLE